MHKRILNFILLISSIFLSLSAIRVFANEAAELENNSINKTSADNFYIEDLLNDAQGVHWQEKTQSQANSSCYGYYDLPKSTSTQIDKSLKESTLFIEANSADYSSDKLFLNKNINIKISDIELNADVAQLDLQSGNYKLFGNVGLIQNNLYLNSSDLNLDTNTKNMQVKNAHFVDAKSKIHGAAEVLETRRDNSLILHQGIFTTCPPKNNSWYIKASTTQISQKEQKITATNIRFYLGSVPVFYFPWLSMSLDKSRVTGFLMPSFKISRTDGVDLAMPFYMNIHPQFDATFIARYIGKRGFLIENEARYLLADSAFFKSYGDFNIGFVPEDKQAKLWNRWFLSTRHSGYVGNNFNYRIDYTKASDSNLTRDISFAADALNSDQVLQLIELNSYWQNWSLSARLKGYQKFITNSSLPNSVTKYSFFDPTSGRTKEQQYYQLPQVLWQGQEYLGAGFSLAITGDITYFTKLLDKKLNQNADIEIVNNSPIWHSPAAFRVALDTKLKANFSNAWGYIKPELGLIYTYYLMLPRNSKNLINQPKHIDANILNLHKLVPNFGLDMGLTLERLALAQDIVYRQSLTPSIYFGFTPYINNKTFNQDFVPFVFDGEETDFTEQDLFSPKRLTGFDRIGDKAIITLALNHKWLRNSDLKHFISFDFIQGFYLANRRIGKIMDQKIYSKTRILSPFISKMNLNITDNLLWQTNFYFDFEAINSLRFFERIETNINWDNSFLNLSLGYLYASEHEKLASNMQKDWRYKKHSSHQVTATGVFNLTNDWRLFGKYARHLTAKMEKEHIAGLEYNNCCWQIQLVYSDKLTSDPVYQSASKNFTRPERDYSVMFNITFKGLVSAGNNINSFLTREIPGFVAKP